MTSNDKIPRSDSKPLRVIESGEILRQTIYQERNQGRKIGLVPTMGALHEGHLSLVRAAREECDRIVTTIFINPAQFGPQEDLAKYPRTLETDLEALARLDVEYVFVPSSHEMYPPGFSTYVEPPAVATPWEGAGRSEHFRGVTTVVLKLFLLAPADIAYFGQKDYQQLMVIRRMAGDLNVPIEIRMCPIVRESDGLAMSSRNRYLNNQQRQQALALSRALARARQCVDDGERETETVLDAMRATLAEADITQVDYVAIADPESLESVGRLESTAVALIAAHVGTTRLIDNCLLKA